MKFIKYFLAVLIIGVAGHAHAASYPTDGTNFDYGSSGPGTFFNWDANFGGGNGSINTGADASVGEVNIVGSGEAGFTLFEPDCVGLSLDECDNAYFDYEDQAFESLTSMTTTAAVGGSISVNWDYLNSDFPEYDPFVWLYDDGSGLTMTEITDPLGDFGQVGLWTETVVTGALFGFGILSLDNLYGFADVGLSDLLFTAAGPDGRPDVGVVPIPPALLLFGTALAGLGLFGRKKTAKAA